MDGAVRLIHSSPLSDASKTGHEIHANLCVPGRDRRVGGLVVAQSGQRPKTPLPWLRTVAFSVKRAPAAGALVSTVGMSTTRSGAGAAPTATVTAA